MRERKFVKLRVDMHEDTKFKIIDRMEQRDLICYIWIRLIALAGKVNLGGELFLSRNIPYTIETLSIEFNREPSQVELAIETFIKLEMVELTEDKIYRVKNFAKHQNIKVQEKIKTEDKIETNSKTSGNKSVANNEQDKEQLGASCEAAADLNNNIISLNNSSTNENSKADDTNRAGNIGSLTCSNDTIKTDESKDVKMNLTQNINTMNNIECIDQTSNDAKIETERIHAKSFEFNVPELLEKKKRVSKGKRKNNNISDEINVNDDNEEVIELYNGERKLGKNEQLVSSFSF
ncbi:replisome organizer region-containing protein [Clostridium sp. DL-VIII]|uniref:phage replisome organizer N-terminal domain-containing protein n=1 Tax=Clostridium sp. DL-VIII TaxID=641107 RepID=UPI00023B07F2|nr:phage replisome organizer N-terminal domain-containing protein [Clostridium sp. DL-VIII]EHJ02171.1 replisome organizer region-containing protein [Clostridium sp. DL-VIII]